MSASEGWRCVWITGASTGIGAAFARRLNGRVAHVALSARSRDKLTALEAEGGLTAYPLDVTDAEATGEVVAAVEAAGGPIDLAVLNAATWEMQSVEDFTIDAVRAGVEVNYMGVIHGLHAVLPGMLARGAGHIAILGSVAGYRGLPNSITYGPTKAALINLAETLRTELEPKGITVSIVNPGFVDTPSTQKNTFEMPGIISADQAAEAMEAGLRRKRYEISFPWGFTQQMKILRALPNWLFFRISRSLVK